MAARKTATHRRLAATCRLYSKGRSICRENTTATTTPSRIMAGQARRLRHSKTRSLWIIHQICAATMASVSCRVFQRAIFVFRRCDVVELAFAQLHYSLGQPTYLLLLVRDETDRVSTVAQVDQQS